MNGLLGKLVGAINKDQTPGYSLGDSVPSYDVANVWSLFRASARDASSSSALVFLFDPTRSAAIGGVGYGSASVPKADLARSGLSQIKRLKHPDILRYVASAENSDGSIFIATEPATPLATLLASQTEEMNRESIQWGLFTISRALGFLHQSGLIHGRINAASVFVTPNGDWKLGGLEAVTQHTAASSLARYVTLQPGAYQSPEFANGNWQVVASSSPGAVDSWSLGCLMFHSHNGSLSSADQLRNTQCIPKQLITAYQKLLASNPTSRAPAGQLPNHPYFKSSKFVELNLFVENLALKGELEREAFLTKLPSLMDRLPDGFCTFKILPMVSDSIMTGNAALSAFSSVLKMKERLSESDFNSFVVKVHATKWYSTSTLDRNLRVEMYSKIESFSTHFDAAAVNSSIFPAMTVAMQDAQSPALRDAAVKSVLCIANMLGDKNLNSTLMSHFARLQVDPEPAIRTNTTVCLGRLGQRLNQTTRNKVLIAAFLRSLKDPFPPARAAGANAFLLTAEMFNATDIAVRILPAVIPLAVDDSSDVRSLSFKIISIFLPVLDKNHEKMSQAAIVAAKDHEVNAGTSASIGRSGSTGFGGISNGVGWGLSSFTSMTAALLTKSESNAGASRIAAGGISSEDFKNMKVNAAASHSLSPDSGLTAVNSSTGTALTHPNTSSLSLGSSPPQPNSKTESFGDEFGEFQHAVNLNDSRSVEACKLNEDEDDDDGWGDMNVTMKSKSDENKDEDDDILALLGPPLGSKATSLNSSRTSFSGISSQDKTGHLPASGSSSIVQKPPSRPVKTDAAGISSRSIPSGGQDPSRRTVKKKTGDDWEALLSGSGTVSKRRGGLGATRR